MADNVKCPKCGSKKIMSVPDSDKWLCYDCKHEFAAEKAPASLLRISLSYGHDANEVLVQRIKTDLEKRAADTASWEQWYQAKFDEIIRIVERDESRRFAGEIETFHNYLKPLKSVARIYDLLKNGLFGCQWLFKVVEKWKQATNFFIGL